MKTIKFLTLLFIAAIVNFQLVSCGSDDDELTPKQPEQQNSPITINGTSAVLKITEAGTLPNYIADVQKTSITELKLSGPINGTDIKFLRSMMQSAMGGKLSKLDLADADIVAGGVPYLSRWGSYESHPRNIAIPGHFREEFNGPWYTENNVIGEYMFSNCDVLTFLILPNTAEYFHPSAIEYCDPVRGITIGKAMKGELGNPQHLRLLSDIVTLKRIDVHPDNEQFTSIDGILYSKDLKTLLTYPSALVSSFNIPEGITCIDDLACFNSELTSVNIPSTVQYIGRHALGACENLTDVYIHRSSPPICGDHAIYDINSKARIHVPAGSYSSYNCFPWNQYEIIDETHTPGSEIWGNWYFFKDYSGGFYEETVEQLIKYDNTGHFTSQTITKVGIDTFKDLETGTYRLNGNKLIMEYDDNPDAFEVTIISISKDKMELCIEEDEYITFTRTDKTSLF